MQCLTFLIAGIKFFGTFVPTVLSTNSNLVFMSGGNAWKKSEKFYNLRQNLVFATIIYHAFWESVIFSGAMITIPTSTDDRQSVTITC